MSGPPFGPTVPSLHFSPVVDAERRKRLAMKGRATEGNARVLYMR